MGSVIHDARHAGSPARGVVLAVHLVIFQIGDVDLVPKQRILSVDFGCIDVRQVRQGDLSLPVLLDEGIAFVDHGLVIQPGDEHIRRFQVGSHADLIVHALVYHVRVGRDRDGIPLIRIDFHKAIGNRLDPRDAVVAEIRLNDEVGFLVPHRLPAGSEQSGAGGDGSKE